MQDPELKNNTMFPGRPLGLFLAVMVAFMIAQLILFELPLLAQVGIIVTQLVVFLGGALLYRAKFAHPETSWPTMRRLGMSPAALGVVLLASISLGFLANGLGALTVYVFPGLEPMAEAYQNEIEALLLPDEVPIQILGAIGVAVVAPVAEEFLFRGTLLAEQRREQVAFSAIFLNGLLFSVMHLNPVAFVSLTVVGCYFAHVTIRSDALWGAILGHAVLNLVNGVVLIRVVDDIASPDQLEIAEIGGALAVLIPVTILLWWGSMRLIGGGDEEADPVDANR